MIVLCSASRYVVVFESSRIVRWPTGEQGGRIPAAAPGEAAKTNNHPLLGPAIAIRVVSFATLTVVSETHK